MSNTPITGGTLISSVATPVVRLTSLQEIQRVFSSEGVTNHTEDFAHNVEVIEETIYRASETVLQYLRTMFTDADLEQSYWARSKATYIACYLLSIRRGNPALYQDDFELAMLELGQARDGSIDIGLPTKPRIVVQNQIVDRRSYQPLRVNHRTSSKVYSGQDVLTAFYGYDY